MQVSRRPGKSLQEPHTVLRKAHQKPLETLEGSMALHGLWQRLAKAIMRSGMKQSPVWTSAKPAKAPAHSGRHQGLLWASAELGKSHRKHLSQCLLRLSLGTTALFHLCSALWTPLAPSEPFLPPSFRPRTCIFSCTLSRIPLFSLLFAIYGTYIWPWYP